MLVGKYVKEEIESVLKIEHFNIKTDLIGIAATEEISMAEKKALAYFRFLQRREKYIGRQFKIYVFIILKKYVWRRSRV
jgi:hypothetical protein